MKKLTKQNLERIKARIEAAQDEAYNQRNEFDFDEIEGFMNDAAYAIGEAVDVLLRRAEKKKEGT